MATVQGYTQQVGKTAAVSTPNINVSAAGGSTRPVNFSTFNKGLGDVVKAINAERDQEDNESVMKAMDAYNKSRFDVLYNENNGLMNTQADGAVGIAESYMEQEKKYRETILSNTKLYDKRKQAALMDMMEKSSQQAYQQVQRHQFQQKEIARDMTLDSNVQNGIQSVQKDYLNEETIDMAMQSATLMIGARYSGVAQSELKADQAMKKYLGQIASSAIQTAIDNEDYATAQKYNDKYGHLLDGRTRGNINRVVHSKAMAQWEDNKIKELYAKYGDNEDAFRAALENESGFGMKQGSSLTSEMRDMIGKIPYYDGKGGTNCARTIGLLPSLKGTAYEGETWVPTFISKAKQRGEWHEGAEGVQPGDLVVVNGDNHMVMMDDGGGTIQNGASHNGVYPDPQSPMQMFGNVTGYIRVKGQGGSEAGPMGFEQKQRLINSYRRFAADQKRLEIARENRAYNEFAQQVYEWKEQGVDYATAMAEARKQAGSDLKAKKRNEAAVRSWYEMKATKGAGNGTPRANTTFEVGVAKDMLRNGVFNNQQEYVEYISQVPGATPKDIYEANKAYQDFDNGRGEFAYKFDDMFTAVLGPAGTGKGKLSAQEKAQMTMGLKVYLGQQISDYIKQNKRQPSRNEVQKMMEDAVTSKVIGTYETEGRIFKNWTNTENVELSGWQMGNLGIRSIRPVAGTDLFEVIYSDGRREQMNAARIQAKKQGDV